MLSVMMWFLRINIHLDIHLDIHLMSYQCISNFPLAELWSRLCKNCILVYMKCHVAILWYRVNFHMDNRFYHKVICLAWLVAQTNNFVMNMRLIHILHFKQRSLAPSTEVLTVFFNYHHCLQPIVWLYLSVSLWNRIGSHKIFLFWWWQKSYPMA